LSHCEIDLTPYRIDGLTEDLKLTGTDFNVALVVFYVPYILVDVPSNWIVKHFKAGRYLPFLITSWGVVSTFLGFTKSYGGLVAARFFLGLCEGGLLGGMIVYLAMFYRRTEMLYRIGLFYCAAPLSGAFGGLLATGLAKINTGGYDGQYRSGNVWLVTNMHTGWPWIFFIEGVITVCFGILCFLFMPNTPADAKFFTEEERSMAQARMMQDAHGSTKHSDVNNEKFDWHWVRMALLSPNTMFCSLAWFFLLVPLYVRLRR
jgi:MFS family permease